MNSETLSVLFDATGLVNSSQMSSVRVREVKNMNQPAFDRRPKNLRLGCTDRLMPMAEQEFAAFFRAVNESFGSEQAQVSADEWLQELMSIDELPASARDWRLITIRASMRLATRLDRLSLQTESQTSTSRTRICVFLSPAPRVL
jgi:cell wall assembly regulator SMI1